MKQQGSDVQKPELSVIVPVFRLRNRIHLMLRSLEAQTLGSDKFEVIIVDDGSDDGTADIVDLWRPDFNCRVLRNSGNRGRSVTRNRGWHQANGEVIIFLDGDMIAHPRLLETYRERFWTENVDVVSGSRWCLDLSKAATVENTLLTKSTDDLWANEIFDGPITGFETLREHSRLGPLPNQMELEAQIGDVCTRYPRSLTRALAFITSNVAVRRAVLAATRGFLPLLARGEDTELGLQLAERGARFVYERRAEAIHMFTNWTASAESQQNTLDALIARHPFTVLVLWWCWAQQPGSEPYRRLVDIAHAEMTGEIAGLDIEAVARQSGIRIPAHFSTTRQGLLSYWQSIGHVSHDQLGRWLDQGVAQGLLHANRRTMGKVFDFALTSSWLNDYTAWRQHLYRNSFFSQHLTRRQLRKRKSPPLSVRWNIRYTIEIPSEIIEGKRSAVNLALPVVTRCQKDLHFEEWDPPDLLTYIQDDNMIVGYPVQATHERVVRASYVFSCRVSEFDPALPEPFPNEDLSIWLRPISLYHLPTLTGLVNKILAADKEVSVVERARRIYDWLLQNTEYRPNGLDGFATVYSGMGHCIQLSRLYIALCRLAGIAARERHGFIVDSHLPGSPPFTGESRGYDSLFMHTWAEFHCPETGWTPVEMLPVGHGGRAVSPWNFPDLEIRRSMCSEQRLFDSYYFGGLDPFRIHGSCSSTKLPQLVQCQRAGWEQVADPEISIRHTVIAQGTPEY